MAKEPGDKNQCPQCPWCGEPLSLVDEEYEGPHARMHMARCSRCNKLISARSEGEPERILRKELIEGNLL